MTGTDPDSPLDPVADEAFPPGAETDTDPDDARLAADVRMVVEHLRSTPIDPVGDPNDVAP